MQLKRNIFILILFIIFIYTQAYADTKIRFIAYAIPTTPSGMVPIGDVNGKGSVAGYFTGNSTNTLDVKARADILANAVETAYSQIPQDPNVINVFVAPEFFFHGQYGPYI